MGLFTRLFRWGKSEAHSVVDKLEDPVKMTEQGLRDLRKDLNESLKGLAEVKALAIRSKREADEKKQIATDYEKKAMLLLTKAKNGELETSEADRLASEALSKKEQITSQALTIVKTYNNHEAMIQKLEANVKNLRSQIGSWETELETLKARGNLANSYNLAGRDDDAIREGEAALSI